MAERLRLRVWSPAETLADVEGVQWIHVELIQARPLTIWPGHAPLLAETASKGVRYADATGAHEIHLPPGILQVREKEVLILVGGDLEASGKGNGFSLERLTDALLENLDQTR